MCRPSPGKCVCYLASLKVRRSARLLLPLPHRLRHLTEAVHGKARTRRGHRFACMLRFPGLCVVIRQVSNGRHDDQSAVNRDRALSASRLCRWPNRSLSSVRRLWVADAASHSRKLKISQSLTLPACRVVDPLGRGVPPLQFHKRVVSSLPMIKVVQKSSEWQGLSVAGAAGWQQWH